MIKKNYLGNFFSFFSFACTIYQGWETFSKSINTGLANCSYFNLKNLRVLKKKKNFLKDESLPKMVLRLGFSSSFMKFEKAK